MINIEILINTREKILEEAKRIGIHDIWVCLPLSPTQGQYFLADIGQITTTEQVVELKAFIQKLTDFEQEIIIFNKQTFSELIESQSDEQRPSFQTVLNSAKRLHELDISPLEAQLQQQMLKNSQKTTELLPSEQSLKRSTLFFPLSAASNSSSQQSRKRQKVEQIEALREKVAYATPDQEEDIIINWLLNHVNIKHLLTAGLQKADIETQEEIMQLAQQAYIKDKS